MIVFQLYNSMMDIHDWIMDIHNTIPDIHNCNMGIYNCIVDIHHCIMDIHNCIMLSIILRQISRSLSYKLRAVYFHTTYMLLKSFRNLDSLVLVKHPLTTC